MLGVLMASASALAYRPFDGTDADVAETGEFEAEIGPVGYYRLGAQHDIVAPAAVLNYGLVHRVELVLQGYNFVSVDREPVVPHDRLLETGFFIKGVLRAGCLQHDSGISIATEVGPLLPTVNASRRFGGQAGFIFTECFGRDFIIHYNVVPAVMQTPAFDLFAGAIFEGPQDLAVRPVAELYVEREFNIVTTYSGLVGAIWRAGDHIDFDMGLRTARVNDVGLGEVRLGFTWTVP
jgi:hypothetical protein